MDNFLHHKNFNVHYTSFGEGREPLLAFPGFHREAEDFRVLSEGLKKYRIFSIDLFHHGTTEIREGRFGMEQFRELISLLLHQEKISRFSVMGFSLGGRLALCAAGLFAERLNEVILLAPYGIKPRRPMAILENSPLAAPMFRLAVKWPGPVLFFTWIGALFGAGNLHNFMKHQLETRERRQKLYDVWQTYLQIQPDLQKIKRLVAEYKIRIRIYSGLRDPLNIDAAAREFISGIAQFAELYVVPLDHNLVCKAMNPYLDHGR